MKILDRLYPDPAIPLRHKNPFTLLVAALLSGQSTDQCVNRISPILFKLAGTPQKMAQLTPARVYRVIKPCGLGPAKSRAIVALSKKILRDFGGQVPDTFAGLESLLGVGHKTASVVMAQGFNQPAFPVDTHIHRLAWRWGLSSGKNVIQTERDLKRLFPQKEWARRHLQIIFFGREHCPALRHDPRKCPICSRFGRKSLFR